VVNVEFDPALNDVLYHYTDFTALKSIFENGEVWATNSRYLNDATETELGPASIIDYAAASQQSINDQIGDYLRGLEGKLTDADETHLRGLHDVRVVAAEIQGACKHALRDTTCFVFSLSMAPDQLSQWRAYAKDGVCIGLSTKSLLGSLESAPALRATMRKVEYYSDPDSGWDSLESIVQFAAGRRQELLSAGWDDEAVRNVTIGQEMMLKIAYLKDASFEEEREVRIAVQGNPNHFTPHRYGLVPRIKIPIAKDAIVSVVVGPGAHSELRQQSIRAYFDNWGFKNDRNSGGRGDVSVTSSRIPYRDW
jgi:hypothetical protein